MDDRLRGYASLEEVIEREDDWPGTLKLADLETYVFEGDLDRAPRRSTVDWTARHGKTEHLPQTLGDLREHFAGGYGFKGPTIDSSERRSPPAAAEGPRPATWCLLQ